MNSVPSLAVTGATGALGGAVARALAEAGIPQRLLVRTPARAPVLADSVVAQASYQDREAAAAALRGVTTLFMVSASESADRLAQHRSFIDAAADAGVEHVIYTSFVGASPTATFTLARDHDATERHIIASGLAFTFLRDNFYLDFLGALAGPEGVIRGPAGSGRVAAVARDDVARVATTVLQDAAAYAGATYNLTGPEALSFDDVARILSIHRGSPVSFQDESIEEAYASRAVYGAPDWQVDAWVSTYTAIARGELAAVSDDVERITGRQPISLAQLVRLR